MAGEEEVEFTVHHERMHPDTLKAAAEIAAGVDPFELEETPEPCPMCKRTGGCLCDEEFEEGWDQHGR